MLPNTVERAIGSLPTVVRSDRRVNGLFRLIKSPSLWDQAYQKVASNKGAMTPGINGTTFDGYRRDANRFYLDDPARAETG